MSLLISKKDNKLHSLHEAGEHLFIDVSKIYNKPHNLHEAGEHLFIDVSKIYKLSKYQRNDVHGGQLTMYEYFFYMFSEAWLS